MSEMFRLYDEPFPEGEYRYVQLAFVVPDVIATAWQWVDLHGAGPFLVMPEREVTMTHNGAEVPLRTRIAVSQFGPLQLEIIEQPDDRTSPYRDVYPMGTGGTHHMCTRPADFDAAIAHYTAAGYPPMTLMSDPQYGRVAYCDTRDAIGLVTEVVERSPFMDKALRGTARLCANWDGTDPVRALRLEGGYDAIPRPEPTA